MKEKVIFGICDRTISKKSLPIEYSYEVSKLLKEGNLIFDKSIIIQPKDIFYKFQRHKERPSIIHNGEDISNISVLLVRGTRGIENEIATLAKSLNGCGTYIFDSVERFNGAKPGKLFTTIERHKKAVGSTSYIAFTKKQTKKLLANLTELDFPLITKPIGGAQGKGVKKLNNLDEAIQFCNQFFKMKKNSPLLLQKYISIQNEYRVLIIGGKSVGVVEKFAAKGKIAANVGQGGNFKHVDDDEIAHFAINNSYQDAILGVDVARTSHGELHIIEANYSPQWKTFQEATNINVAQKILEYGKSRLSI